MSNIEFIKEFVKRYESLPRFPNTMDHALAISELGLFCEDFRNEHDIAASLSSFIKNQQHGHLGHVAQALSVALKEPPME